MKAFIIFLLSFIIWGNIHAQTTIYSQDFETTYPEWNLSSTDLGGVVTPNYWTVTNVYSGGSALYVTTPDQPSGITGYPESYYMHIRSVVGPANATFNAAGTHSYLSAMNTSIVTTGYTNVNISFWWLCRGNASCFGRLYYRTGSSSTAWVQVSTASIPAAAFDSFNNSYSTWTLQTIHLDSFDNQPFLEFAFQFHNAPPAGVDPSFAVDDIKVVGTPAVVAPVASYTTTATSACQDSCITFTSTTTGTVDSVRWSIIPTAGAAITTPTANVTSICFTTAGTYSVTLTAYNSAGSSAATHVVNITPTPHPVITKSGHTLSVASAGSYSGFQWVMNTTTIITGATNSSYTYSVAATYNVVVDSDGCYGISNTISTLGVAMVNSAGNNYWLAQTGNNIITLFASQPIDEAFNVTIYDATGRKMLSDDTWKGNSAKQINCSFFPPGLYIIRLCNNNTSTVFRWLK